MPLSFDAEIFSASAQALLQTQSTADQMMKRFALACFLLDGFDPKQLKNHELDMLVGRFAQIAHLFAQHLPTIRERLTESLAEEPDFDTKIESLHQSYFDLFETYPELKRHVEALFQKQAQRLLDNHAENEREQLRKQIDAYDQLEQKRLTQKNILEAQKKQLLQKRSHAQQLEAEIVQLTTMLTRMKETTQGYSEREAELLAKKKQIVQEKQRFLEKRAEVKQLEQALQETAAIAVEFQAIEAKSTQLQQALTAQQEEIHTQLTGLTNVIEYIQTLLRLLPASLHSQKQFLMETAQALKIEHKCLQECEQVDVLLKQIQHTLKKQIHETEEKLKAFRTQAMALPSGGMTSLS